MSSDFYLPDGTFYVGSYMTRAVSSYVDFNCESILDVGCGPGLQMEFYRSRGIDRAVGIDIDDDAKKACAELGFECLHVDLDNTELRLPFYDNEFDIVLCEQTLEHVKYPRLVAEELYRVANNKVLISVPGGRSFYSPNHIHFWFETDQLRIGLSDSPDSAFLPLNWVFAIEVVISKPADVHFGQVGFIVCVYKMVNTKELENVFFTPGDHFPIIVYNGKG